MPDEQQPAQPEPAPGAPTRWTSVPIDAAVERAAREYLRSGGGWLARPTGWRIGDEEAAGGADPAPTPVPARAPHEAPA